MPDNDNNSGGWLVPLVLILLIAAGAIWSVADGLRSYRQRNNGSIEGWWKPAGRFNRGR